MIRANFGSFYVGRQGLNPIPCQHSVHSVWYGKCRVLKSGGGDGEIKETIILLRFCLVVRRRLKTNLLNH